MKIIQLENNLKNKLLRDLDLITNDPLRRDIIKRAQKYIDIHAKNINEKKKNFNEEQISTIISLNYDLYFTIKDIYQAVMEPGDLQENINIALENRKRALHDSSDTEVDKSSPAIRFCEDVNNIIIFDKKNENVKRNVIGVTFKDQAPKNLFENIYLISNEYLEIMHYIDLKLFANIHNEKIEIWQDLKINQITDTLKIMREIVNDDVKIKNFPIQLFNQCMHIKTPEDIYSLLTDLIENQFIILNDVIAMLPLNDFTGDQYWNNVIAVLTWFQANDVNLSLLLIKAMKQENSNIVNKLINDHGATLNNIDFLLQLNSVDQEKYLKNYLQFGRAEEIIQCLENKLIYQDKEKLVLQRDQIYQFLKSCVKTFSHSNDLEQLRDRVFSAQEAHCDLIKRRGSAISPWPRYKGKRVSSQWDIFLNAVDDKKDKLTSSRKTNSSTTFPVIPKKHSAFFVSELVQYQSTNPVLSRKFRII